MSSSYGLGAAGLTGFGLDQKNDAMQTLGRVAGQETQRNIQNEQTEAARKAGNVQLGSTVGALGGAALGAKYGSVVGPWGTVLGGVVGAVAGSLFSAVFALVILFPTVLAPLGVS
jgi:outer membrane lipoprotein SlyB